MKKIIFLLLITFSIFFQSIFAACENPEYELTNVCTTDNCYNTDKITGAAIDYNYILKDSEIIHIENFEDYIENKLDWIGDKYEDEKITIKKFCTWSGCKDKEISIRILLRYSNYINIASEYIDEDDEDEWNWEIYEWDFNLEKRYKDGKDYFFQNYDKIMDQVESNWNYDLSDIDKYIIWYTYDASDKHILKLKNVCENNSCEKSSIKDIKISSTDSIKLLKWTKKSLSLYNNIFIDEDSINMNKNWFIAWNTFSFTLNAYETLPIWECDLWYKYTVSYAYEWEEEIIFLEENFNLTEEGVLEDVENYLLKEKQGEDLYAIKSSLLDDRLLKLKIIEWVRLNKSGRVYFYFDIISPTWEHYKTQINLWAIDVYPSYPVESKSSFELIWFDDSINYYINDTIMGRFHLKDKYDNVVYEDQLWIKIKHETDDAKFYKDGDYIDGPITEVKNQWIYPDAYFDFKIRFEEEGFFKKKFYISYPKKDNNNETTWEVEVLEFYILEQWQVWKFIILSKGSADGGDFDITCTNQPIKITIRCTGDNFSGCRHKNEISKIFPNESSNWESWFLKIDDRAYNLKQYAYSINHIDMTAPNATFSNFPEWWKIKANWEPLEILLKDSYPWWCNGKVGYLLRVNNVEIERGTLEWGSNISIAKFMEETGVNNIRLDLIDHAWNTKTYTKTLTIYPNDLSQINSSLELISPSKNSIYANNILSYTYKLNLKDKYNNNIYTKNIDEMKQDCDGITDCKTISSNIVDTWWVDTLEISWIGFTSAQWQKDITIKSIAPWVFTENFTIEMNKWNDAYEDISTTQKITLNLSDNSFKKVYKWQISIKDDPDNEVLLDATQTVVINIDTLANDDNIINPIIYDFTGSLAVLIDNPEDYSLVKSWYVDESFSKKYINTTINYTSLNGTIGDVGLKSHPYVDYTIDLIRVKYWITESDAWWDNSLLTINPGGLKWVKIVWISQSQGKLTTSGQDKNSSNISTIEYRNSIKKNAEILIRDMENWDNKEGIYYLNQNYGEKVKLSELKLDGVKTLIIKDMNLIIDENINLEDENGENYLLWIIILWDYYNNSETSNILVKPDIQYINAAIFADWGFISIWGDRENIENYIDSSDRTLALKQQLIVKWTLITRNTIWWSIETDGNYMLPWGSYDSNKLENAKMYDLNLVRRWNKIIEENQTIMDTNNQWYDNPFIIVYDSRLQNSPPPGF